MTKCRSLLIILALTSVSITAFAARRPAGKVIINRWNRGGCQFTNSATFSLSKGQIMSGFMISRLWNPGQRKIGFTLHKGGRQIYGNYIVRGNCDPHQRSWCEGIFVGTSLGLKPGSYAIKVRAGKLCQNRASGRKGYIRLYSTGPHPPRGARATIPSRAAKRTRTGKAGYQGRFVCSTNKDTFVLTRQGNRISNSDGPTRLQPKANPHSTDFSSLCWDR